MDYLKLYADSNADQFTRHLRAKGIRIAHTTMPNWDPRQSNWMPTVELVDKLSGCKYPDEPRRKSIRGEQRRRCRQWIAQLKTRTT